MNDVIVDMWVEGTVRFFSKTYGFIDGDNIDGDIFAHFKRIEGDGYRTLKEGERVQFTLMRGSKGLYADQIRRLSW